MSEEQHVRHGKDKRAGKGSHGSLTKAGKMRFQQPKRWEDYLRKTTHNLPKRNKRKSGCPRVKNRVKYKNRVLLERKCGQHSDMGLNLPNPRE